MIKKTLIVLLLLIVLAPTVLAFFLSDFPGFINNSNALLVIGDNASQFEAESGSGYVAPSLELVDYSKCEGVRECIVESAKKTNVAADGVDDLYRKDIVSIGGPCANSVTAQIMNLPMTWPECAAGFTDGLGRIMLFNNQNRTQLIIAGFSAADTRKAAEFIAARGRRLRGKEVEVTSKSSFRVILSNEEKHCIEDEDCVLTPDGCCGCSVLAVNKALKGMYRGNCEDVACTTSLCLTEPQFAKCINSACSIFSSNNSVGYNWDMFNSWNESIVPTNDSENRLEDEKYYCMKDGDCVPAQCCHPSYLVNRKFAPDCSGTKSVCTASCSGPLDCRAWKPICRNSRCDVV